MKSSVSTFAKKSFCIALRFSWSSRSVFNSKIGASKPIEDFDRRCCTTLSMPAKAPSRKQVERHHSIKHCCDALSRWAPRELRRSDVSGTPHFQDFTHSLTRILNHSRYRTMPVSDQQPTNQLTDCADFVREFDCRCRCCGRPSSSPSRRRCRRRRCFWTTF